MKGKRRDNQTQRQMLSMSQGAAEFILKPRGLPHPQGNLDSYREQCQATLLRMLEEAIDPITQALPDRTTMVQCLSKPPIKGRANFSLPVLIRPPKSQDPALLGASFAHVTHYLIHGKSSHIRMREIGDCTRGNLVVFSPTETGNWLSTDVANVVHVKLPAKSPRLVPSFDDCLAPLRKDFLSQSGGIWRFKMEEFIKLASESGWSSITKQVFDDSLKPTARPNPCTRAKHHERTKAVSADILQDTEYLRRVSVLASHGPIVLCLPQTHYFEDRGASTHHPDSVVYDSGLTILLSKGEPISRGELEQCYWVAFAISSFLAGVNGLANKLAHEAVRESTHTFSKSLAHEIGNAGLIIERRLALTGLDSVARDDIVARAHIAATAAQAVVAAGESSEQQNAAPGAKEIIRRYKQFRDFKLTVMHFDESALAARKLPPTFTLLLNEMLRNAYKHSARDALDARTATLDFAFLNHAIVVTITNEPRKPELIDNIKDGLSNPVSTKLARLRELAALLGAVPSLKVLPPKISVSVTIKTGTP